MKFSSATIISFLTLAVVSLAAVAAPGSPIGGIIVKGGKNPGGQMLVLGTTDAEGKFKIKFAESGDYKLEFVGKANKTLVAREADDVRLEYAVRAVADTQKLASAASHTARFSSNLGNAQLLVTVPKGGAEIAGVLQTTSAVEASPSAERAINESGVSVKSSKPKGSK
jgi:hypothetical protein